MKHFDLVIIGAGAAGLMCAVESAKRGRKVIILEKSKSAAEKIRISGGGRCNFTNLKVTKDNFLSDNPSFCISALSEFTQDDFIEMVQKHRIKYHEKTLGQLFCDISSKEIINMFLNECNEYGVEIVLNCDINDISKKNEGFLINSANEDFQCESLVIATGGLSIPKMGATDFGYQIAKKFNIDIIKTLPGLVPLTLDEKTLSLTKNLAGVALFSEVTVEKTKFRENILFTHRGLSGPAILQISSYLQNNQEFCINLQPDLDVFEWLKAKKTDFPKSNIEVILAEILPKRLALFMAQINNVTQRIADISNKNLANLAKNINSWKVSPSGNEGYAKAEVTLGGVNCNEISSKTFESKKVKNLYFIGEVVDVTGHLGGYNFQWAWSSGYACGKYA